MGICFGQPTLPYAGTKAVLSSLRQVFNLLAFLSLDPQVASTTSTTKIVSQDWYNLELGPLYGSLTAVPQPYKPGMPLHDPFRYTYLHTHPHVDGKLSKNVPSPPTMPKHVNPREREREREGMITYECTSHPSSV